MSFASVTERRPRKSLLGTRRAKRESILPLLSDNLFSIYEERKEPRDSALVVEEPASFEKVTKPESPRRLKKLTPEKNDEIDVSPMVQQESTNEQCDVTCGDLNVRRKRLDSLFSPDDSFVVHETMMIASEESVLATTLANISPETDDHPPLNNDVTDEEITVARSIDSGSTKVDGSAATSNDYDCDVSSDELVIKKMLQFLEIKIQEKSESVITYRKQSEELQKKINESNKEIEDIREMKEFLLNRLYPTCEVGEKENVEPLCCTLNENSSTEYKLPVSTEPPNKFVQEMRSNIKYMETSRKSRAPRTSTLIKPHSMSFCIKS